MAYKNLCVRMILFSLASVAMAASQSNDFLPLAVGNQWTYHYWWQHIEYATITTDTGTATCYIYSKTSSNDSVFWSILETRDIVRLHGDSPDSTRAIVDSSRFSLLEQNSGDHAMSIVGSSSIFLLAGGYSRYYPSDPDDTVLAGVGNGYNFLNYIIFQRLTGPIDIHYSFYGAHIGTAAHHTLSNALITSVPQTQQSGSPFVFTLSQNYPNPFNPTTSIRFAVPVSQFVFLAVYDLLGREVAVLVHEEKPAGTYTVQWNAAGISSGVYLYRLHAGKLVETKKLILLR
jgi:hypothetical protein